MKTKFASIITLAIAALVIAGCASQRLETGGAYAPVVTNDLGQVTIETQPDYAFFVADSAFELAVATMDTTFQIERDNRALLWQISPDIKRTLDEIRPQAVDARRRYAIARAAYKMHPLPANLDILMQALVKIQALNAAATAAIQTPP